jgi:hypothetical protein
MLLAALVVTFIVFLQWHKFLRWLGMYKMFLLFCALAIFACTNNQTGTTAAPNAGTVHANANDTIVTSAQPVVLNGCYQMLIQQDTALLQLQLHDSLVTGNLSYHRQQKDNNNGTLKGVLRDDKIYADYTFQSEGRTSVRQVVFKIQQAALLEGTGDMVQQKNQFVFKDTGRLHFSNTHAFVKAACP